MNTTTLNKENETKSVLEQKTAFTRLPSTIKPPNMVYSTTPWVEEEREEGFEPNHQDFQSGLLFDSQKVYQTDPKNPDKFKEYFLSLN